MTVDSHFNTSNVMVLHEADLEATYLLERFQYIQCYGSSKTVGDISDQTKVFQYIQCYGSSRAALTTVRY